MILFNKSYVNLVCIYNTNITIEPRKAFDLDVKNESIFKKELVQYSDLEQVTDLYCLHNNIEIMNKKKEEIVSKFSELEKEINVNKEDKSLDKVESDNEDKELTDMKETKTDEQELPLENIEEEIEEVKEEVNENKTKEITETNSEIKVDEIKELLSNRKKKKNK